MSKFKVITKVHPAAYLYFNFLKENFGRTTYFKGYFKFKEVKNSYEAEIYLEKYIPKTFILVGFLGFLGSAITAFLGGSLVIQWVLGVPALIILFAYWVLQSKVFYYLLIYLALRKRGYKDTVILRGL